MSIRCLRSPPGRVKRGVDLISDELPFGRLLYEQLTDAIEYAKHLSRSHRAMIRVYDDPGNVIVRTSMRASSKSGEFAKQPSAVFGRMRTWPSCSVSTQTAIIRQEIVPPVRKVSSQSSTSSAQSAHRASGRFRNRSRAHTWRPTPTCVPGCPIRS